MRVLLPAPFSPIRANTSPVETDKFTLSLATTPGNRLVMPRNSNFISCITPCHKHSYQHRYQHSNTTNGAGRFHDPPRMLSAKKRY